jgi:hypothetical protein
MDVTCKCCKLKVCACVPYLEPLRDVAVVAGGEDDRVGGDATAVDELGASAEEPFDPRHDLDVAGADPVERADVEHGRPAPGVLELQRAPRRAPDAELVQVAEEDPREEDEDPVDQPERQEAEEEDGDGEGRDAEHLPRQDVHLLVDKEREIKSADWIVVGACLSPSRAHADG